MWVFLIIFLIIILFIYFKVFRKQKVLNYGCLLVITGGIKCGKTTSSMKYIDLEYAKSLKAYKKYLRKQRFYKKFFKKDLPDAEMPLIYSNVPLNIPYVQLTNDLVRRQNYRFAYGSIVYINEVNFLANQWDTKDYNINFTLNAFTKLFGHEVHSVTGYDGLLICDTQNVKDMHYSFKNCISTFNFISSKKSFLHFWLKLGIREYVYCDGVENNVNSDNEDNVKYLYVSKKYFKWFDCANMSRFTDSLQVDNRVIEPQCLPDLKVNKVVSINPLSAKYFPERDIQSFIDLYYSNLYGGVEDGKENIHNN